MKAFVCSSLLFLSVAVSAQTGIGTSTPNASAQLDVVSTSKGILIPRMTKTQRNAIASPATGLLIYQSTDSTGFYFYNGTSWTFLHAGVLSVANGGTGASSLSGAKVNLGLDNVNNTSDANKPISNATQAALDLKANTADILNYTQGNFLQFSDTAAMLSKYVNRWSDQSVDGAKSFTKDITVNGITIGNPSSRYNSISIGAEAQKTNTGVYNVSLGNFNLQSGSGVENTAIGYTVMAGNTTGSRNTGVGLFSFYTNTSGDYNTAIGYTSLGNNTTGSYNTALGAGADMTATGLSNATAIGYEAKADSNNLMQLGNANLALVRTSAKLKLGAITLPNTDGTNGQVLTTDGSGAVNWSGPFISSIGSISGTSTANGASIISGELNLAPADATNGGVVTTGTQTFAGAKTFNSDITVNNIPIGNGNLGSLGLSIGTTSPSGRSGTGLLNTAIGYYNMLAITTGELNTAIGPNALIENSIGNNNTATGVLSIEKNISGNNNTAIGYESLKNNVTGDNNTALGAMAGVDSVNLSNTTAVGYMAKVDSSNMMQLGNGSLNLVRTSGKLKLGTITFPNTDGTDGQVLSTNGSGAVSWSTPFISSIGNISGSSTANGASITSGEFNLAPADATNGGVVTTGTQTFAGEKTFTSNLTANGVQLGNGGGAPDNTAIGNDVLGANNGGDGANTAIGYNAMKATTSGYENAAIGAYAMLKNTDGNRNTAIGRAALQENTTGSYNASVGFQSLLLNTSGERNTACGTQSLYNNTTGNDNVAVGYDALVNNIKGEGNTAVGRNALINNVKGNYNTVLGFTSDVVGDSINNSIAIGYGAVADQSNMIQLGNGDVTKARIWGQLQLGAITLPNTDGTNGQVLTTDGSGTVSWQNASIPAARELLVPVREVADEFVFAGGASGFELTQTPAADSKVKMFINGMRVSNAAYAITGTTVTYDSSKNKDIVLRKGDVVQFDFYY